MQLALLADVHGNLEALTAVLDDLASRASGARLICAGDVVGYGPDPEACIERLCSHGALIVLGNHEEMVLGRRDFTQCVYAGITAALWTRKRLARASRALLAALPTWVEAAPGVIVCHGDLASANTYVSTEERAHRALDQLRNLRPEARLLICGHTHEQVSFTRARGFVHARPGDVIELPQHPESCLINPGAVGQERSLSRRSDGCPLARYAVLDLERGLVSYVGVHYDHAATLRKLRAAGLVSQVTMVRPRGLARQVENMKRSWALASAARRSRRSAIE